MIIFDYVRHLRLNQIPQLRYSLVKFLHIKSNYSILHILCKHDSLMVPWVIFEVQSSAPPLTMWQGDIIKQSEECRQHEDREYQDIRHMGHTNTIS